MRQANAAQVTGRVSLEPATLIDSLVVKQEVRDTVMEMQQSLETISCRDYVVAAAPENIRNGLEDGRVVFGDKNSNLFILSHTVLAL
jgi:hypothetical protein